MPRRARLVLPDVTVHVIRRGNNRQLYFYQEPDYRIYLQWLQEYAGECECRIHAYVMMTNHVDLLATPARADSLGAMMKRLGQRYVQYVNCSYQRSGTLWVGRYKSCLANNETCVPGCYRYIELNPVRAGMVQHPAEYRWSSYRANTQGDEDSVITPHPLYLALHSDKLHRNNAYRDLFGAQLELWPSALGDNNTDLVCHCAMTDVYLHRRDIGIDIEGHPLFYSVNGSYRGTPTLLY